MTISSDIDRDQQSTNGVTAVFTVPFRILDATHLRVIRSGGGSLDVEFVLNSDFTVVAGGVNSPVTILGPPLIAGYTLTFLRNVPATQEADYVENDPFPAASHEGALDKLTMIIQQARERLNRAMVLAETLTGYSAALPTPVTGQALAWGPSGIVNGDFAGAGDLTLRNNLAVPTAGDTLGANLVGYLAPGVGAIETNMHRVTRALLPTVQLYASAGHAVDAATFTRAFAAHDAIRVPAGLYEISGDITCTGKPLTIIGDGIGVTEIRFTGNGGIKFTGGAQTDFGPNVLNVIGLTLTTTVANTQPAIQATWTGGSGAPPKGCTFRDLEIRATSDTGYFAKGIDLFNARDTIFDNVICAGRHKLAGTYGMTVGVDIRGDSDPVEFWFGQCYFYWCDIAIQATTECEGIYVQNSSLSFNECGIKFYVDPGTVEPVLHVQNTYLNGTGRQIDIKNVAYTNITGCGLSSDNSNATADWVGVRCEQSTAFIGFLSITDCYFAGTGYAGFSEYGIQLYNAQQTFISGFRCFNLDIGMYFDASCVGLKLRDPVFVSTTTWFSSDTDSVEYAPRQGPGSSYLVNGGFDIWQRGSTFASAGAGIYTADRWGFFRGSFAAGATVSRQSAAYPAFSEYALRMQRDNGNSSTTQLTVTQALESIDSKKLRGRDVVLSFLVRKGADYSGGDVTARMLSGTGADQPLLGAGLTGEVTLINGTVTPTTAFRRRFIVGTMGTTAAQLGIEFKWTPTGTAGANDWIEITDVKLEQALLPSAYEGRSFAEELALCQRYYEKSYDYSAAAATNTVVGVEMIPPYTPSNDLSRYKIPFKVVKRVTPAITLYASDGTVDRVDVIDSGLKTTVATTAGSPGLNGFRGWAASGTGNTPGTSRTGFHWVASAEF